MACMEFVRESPNEGYSTRDGNRQEQTNGDPQPVVGDSAASCRGGNTTEQDESNSKHNRGWRYIVRNFTPA